MSAAPMPGADTAGSTAKPETKIADPKAKTDKPAGDAKPRKPRVDYGYAPSSIIHIVQAKEGEEPKFHGKRKEYYDLLCKHDGKTVNDFEGAWPDKNDPPRGWVRFFVQNGNVTLERVATAEDGKEKK